MEVRSTLVAAKTVSVQLREIEKLGLDLRQAYTSLAVFSGASGDARHELFNNATHEKVAHAKRISTMAISIVAAPDQIRELSFQTISKTKLELDLVSGISACETNRVT